ncbi:MAG: hypothetical protein K2N23_05340 [Clostridia bacterium]|nr:hypothetical protein [Clostridia bacterium]
MQLFIILALLLYGGGNAKNMLSEVKPVLESIGGEEMQRALKSAEEISEVLSLVKPFAGGQPQPHTAAQVPKSDDYAFPLAPISAIADKEITYSLNRYIQAN